ncbi:alpha/beta hydrolase [Pandoraea pneumonica]|uniref:alpha/beta hydrolase n=1 Tax=Pandoraea pneumonica TaxID=2508299 RepID=UPI003CE88C73
MTGVADQFKSVDYSDLPPVASVIARDGTPLAYRRYGGKEDGTASVGAAILVHGSSADSKSLHVLAKDIASRGFTVYALDIRGHGATGLRGNIAYVGQLDDDLEDFVAGIHEPLPKTLVGFSSGGGFALRIAGGRLQSLFDRYLLIAPFISHDAPTSRPRSGGWVSVGMPRMIVLTILNRFGLHWLNSLPVIRFALSDAARGRLTETYSYNLMTNFRALPDYRQNIAAVHRPLHVVAGEDDEFVIPGRYASVFAEAKGPVAISLLPNTGHIAMTVDRHATQAIADTLAKALDSSGKTVLKDAVSATHG